MPADIYQVVYQHTTHRAENLLLVEYYKQNETGGQCHSVSKNMKKRKYAALTPQLSPLDIRKDLR
jgi:hypothetical protein